MMTFREFLLNEQPGAVFKAPVSITVDVDGKKQNLNIDMIDVRAEDWGLEPVGSQSSAGIVLQNSPKTLVKPFTLPLADGQFINSDFFGTEIGPEVKYPRMLARKDWAKFAQFLLGDKVVRQPQFQRSNDAIAS